MFPQFGYLPFCEFCGGYVNENRPADLHEFLIKRNVVQSWPKELRDLIYHPFNCALVHHTPCHMEYGQTTRITAILVQKHIDWYGADPIIHWIQSLPLTPETAQTFINIINANRRAP